MSSVFNAVTSSCLLRNTPKCCLFCWEKIIEQKKGAASKKDEGGGRSFCFSTWPNYTLLQCIGKSDWRPLHRLFIMATSHQAMQAAVCFRELLGKVFNDLLEQVPDPAPSLRLDSVKTSLRSISLLYRKGLCRPSQSERSNWNDAAKRCAYFFLYFTHHCYLVYVSLQQVRPVSWKNRREFSHQMFIEFGILIGKGDSNSFTWLPFRV